MEEIEEKLGALGKGDGESDQKSDFEGLYKNWGNLGSQEQRRKDLLDSQKSFRNTEIDGIRGILDSISAIENKSIWKSQNHVSYRPSIYVAGFNKVSNYRNVLMLSEWLIEKPEDFQENWYVVPCPKGVRMLLVANMGTTKCFSKYGQFRFEARTALPGGNPCDNMRKHCTILDCFYDEKTTTMYVLDLLAWSDQSMTNGQADFRYFWLTSKFAESPELERMSKKNRIIFKLLPKVSCDKQSFDEFMSKFPYFESDYPRLDGLLFYHKHANYVSGETPLVGWLFPYMVREVLGEDIKVHESYLAGKPAGYVNQADFIRKFEEKNAKRSYNRRNSDRNDHNHEKTMEKGEEPMDDGTDNNNIGVIPIVTEDITNLKEDIAEDIQQEVLVSES